MKIEKFSSFTGLEILKFANLIKSGFDKKLCLDYFIYTRPVHICVAVDEQKEPFFGKMTVEKVQGSAEYCIDVVNRFLDKNPEQIAEALDLITEDTKQSSKEKYIGGIVVEKIPNLDDVFYLDKIVVDKTHRGKGIGKMLWQELNGYSSKLMWRAKKENPIIDFYEKQSDGSLTFPEISDYTFFYYGINASQLQTAVDYAIKKKPTIF